MRVSCTPLPGVYEIEPKVFDDSRGFFLETYRASRYSRNNMAVEFRQSNHTHSAHRTLRGLHYQMARPQGKLVYAARGEVLDVAVDIRRGSPHFGQWHAVLLNDTNHKQLFIPPDFAHGFCVLSETVDLIYLLTDEYDPDDQYAIRWNDPDIGIRWPIKDPILSGKDQICSFLKDVPPDHLPEFQSNA